MAGNSYHSYYEIGREELEKGAKIPIMVCKEPGEAFYELALEMVTEIEKTMLRDVAPCLSARSDRWDTTRFLCAS